MCFWWETKLLENLIKHTSYSREILNDSECTHVLRRNPVMGFRQHVCEFFQMYFCVSTQSPQYIHVNSKRSLIETVCFFHFWQQNSIFYHINIYWHSLCLFNTFYFTSNDIAAVYKPFKCSCWRNTTLCTRLALFCKMTCMSLFSICQFFSFFISVAATMNSPHVMTTKKCLSPSVNFWNATLQVDLVSRHI